MTRSELLQVRHRATGLMLGVGLVLTAERSRALVLDRAAADRLIAAACEPDFEAVDLDEIRAA